MNERQYSKWLQKRERQIEKRLIKFAADMLAWKRKGNKGGMPYWTDKGV